MNPNILILAGLYDFSADLVCLRLKEAGVSFLRLNREQIGEFKVTVNPLSRTLCVGYNGSTWEIAQDLNAVWFRQPVFLRNLPAQPLSPQTQLERSQWMGLLRGLTIFENATWMNHPRETYHAESKLLQLAKAVEVGFNVPKTVAGNDANAIKAAFPGRRFAIKPVDTVLLRDGDEDLFAYMSIADPNEVYAAGLETAPIIAQELFDSKYDVRVTVIGEELSAVRIKNGNRKISGDWRLTPKSELTYEDMEIPSTIRKCCFRLMSRLGLLYAGIDLLETSEGYWFLEANPTGEFSWLISADRPYDAMIAKRLTTQSSHSLM